MEPQPTRLGKDNKKKRTMGTYKFPIVAGSFSKADALNIIGRLVDAKIKYHEEKIMFADNEEDIKMREGRIKQLQKDFYEARLYLERLHGNIEIHSDIVL